MAETDLTRLLRAMRPTLRAGSYVFATIPSPADIPASLDPVMVFREVEGVTVVARKERAEAAGLAFAYPCRMITLDVHSALDAVGFLAAVTAALAAASIGVNAASAFFHDHLFVPVDRAEDAMAVLERLAAGA